MKHEIIYTPQCLCCKHYRDFTPAGARRCDAFPDGIPREILSMEVSHQFEYPGDHGIRYEKQDITLVTA